MVFTKEYRSQSFFINIAVPGMFILFISLFGLLDSLSFLVYIGIFLLILNGAASVYVKFVDQHIDIKNESNKIRCYPGDEGEIKISVAQKGLLPILGGKLIVVYDRTIDINKTGHTDYTGTGTVEIPLRLLSFEEKRITLPFKAMHRGVARIRTIKMEFPNIFGFGQITLRYNPLYKTEIIIYPSLKQVDYLDIMKPNKKGEHETKHSIFEQPILPIGTRDYEQGDPFNRIHWKASAREGKLQTKIVEQVSELSWLVIMNAKAEYKRDYENIEDYLKYAAYISKYATELNIPFEIYINIPARNAIPFYHLPLGSGKSHYIHALETLARFERHGMTTSYQRMLSYIDRRQKPLYIIHMGELTEDEQLIFKKWQAYGHYIYTVNHGERAHIQPLSMIEGGKSYGYSS